MMRIHDDPAELDRQVGNIARALFDIASSATRSNLRRLYDAAIEYPVSDAQLAVENIIRQRSAFRIDRLERTGRWLAENAPDRDAVKLGIGLLNVAANQANNPLLVELASHGEFTDGALNALAGTTSEIQAIAFAVARRTTGWGRVAAVERLDGSVSPEIRRWMLLNGHGIHVYEPTRVALMCARTGDLAAALTADELAPIELLAYTGLFADLRWSDDGSDVPYLDEYADAALAAAELARHLRRPSSDIRLWERVWLMAASIQRGDEIAGLSAIAETLREFAGRESWRDVAHRSVGSQDPATRSAAERAIAVFGI
jgi:hypothetical protein